MFLVCFPLYILAIVKQIPFETPSDPSRILSAKKGDTRTGDSTSTGTTSTGGTASGPAVAGYTGGQLQLDRDRFFGEHEMVFVCRLGMTWTNIFKYNIVHYYYVL